MECEQKAHVSRCAERQRGAGAMTGAEITAAGLSVPELVIRCLSDDDDEGVVRDRSKQCPSSQWKQKPELRNNF